MTREAALRFQEGDSLGVVAGVDTTKIMVRVTSPIMMTRVGVGNLAAIRGSTENEFLIGIIDRVTRSFGENVFDPDVFDLDEYGQDYSNLSTDVVRVVLVGTYKVVYGNEANVFKRGADSFPQIDRECYFLHGANLQRFMNLLGSGLEDAERLEIGRYISDQDAVAIANGDKFFQRHASILGSTGSGKSWCVALLLERAATLRYPNIIVFDMHGEYMPLCKGEEGYASSLRIAGPADLEDPGEDALFLPYWLLGREEMLSMFLERSDQNAPNQASRFTYHVRELKEETLEKEDKAEVLRTFTVDSPVPYRLEELLERLNYDNEEMVPGTNRPKKGDWNDRLTRFLSRLEAKIEDRRYGFLFNPPAESLEYDWLSKQLKKLLGSGDEQPGIKIVDFSEVPPDVLPVVAAVLARLVYNVQFWSDPSSRTPFTILCDEAHLYLPVKEDADAVERQALGVFERIAKEGRKYGTSLVVVSQRPADVSRTILSQCNNFVVLRLSNERDRATIRSLVPDSLSALTEALPLLDTGECILLGDAVLLPARIKLNEPDVKPDSATRDFWTDWSKVRPDSDAITESVEAMRRQSRR